MELFGGVRSLLLTLLFKFGGDLMEILPKNKLSSFFVDTV